MSEEKLDEKISKINELLNSPGLGFVDLRRTIKVQIAKGIDDVEENIEYTLEDVANGITDAADALESQGKDRELVDDLVSIAKEIRNLANDIGEDE